MLESEEVVQDRWQAPSKRQVAPVRKVCFPLEPLFSASLGVSACVVFVW